jgi:cyclopropane fatty-acyl-phospholipid synthase-like methyltransferase
MTSNYGSFLELILGKSKIYDLAMSIVGARSAKEYIAQEINAAPGNRVLDIGCGTASILAFLPSVNYIGIDSNPKYISQAKVRFGDLGDFRCISVDDLHIETTEKFDRILLVGVLHHLTNLQIQSLMEKISGLLSHKGRLITYDGVLIPHQNPIARLLLKLDRGRYVRYQPEYISLLSSGLTVEHSHVKTDFLRIPYSVLFTTSMVQTEKLHRPE